MVNMQQKRSSTVVPKKIRMIWLMRYMKYKYGMYQKMFTINTYF